MRRELAGQAEVVGIIERHNREAHFEADCARDGVPDDVMASQVEAMNTSKAMAQCCEPRTVQLKKRASHLWLPAPAASLTGNDQGTTRTRSRTSGGALKGRIATICSSGMLCKREPKLLSESVTWRQPGSWMTG